MEKKKALRGMILATGLGFVFAFCSAGCGSGSSSAPAAIAPEVEKKTADMLKNKSADYNARFRKNGGRP